MSSYFKLLFIVLICIVSLISAKNYYDILGIESDASDADIKRAFRKLSLKYHPDKNPGDEDAHKKYIEITEAYDVLGDAEKKDIYDYEGYEALSRGPQQNTNLSPFDFLFGGGNAGGRPRGPDLRIEVPVTLEDLYNGTQANIQIQRNVICKKCRGSGAKDSETEKCSACRGKGIVTKMQTIGPGFQMQTQQPCEKCNGNGKIPKHKCPICNGDKVVKEQKDLAVVIEKGMTHGQKIVFQRQSEQKPGLTPGDVVVTINQKNHPKFIREGDDLRTDTSITLKEALLGYTRTIKQLDGRNIVIQSSEVTQPFKILTLVGEGMPKHDVPSEAGNMYVKMNIAFPDKLTEAQKQKVLELLP